MTPWYASLYTGLFASFGPSASRPHDPRLTLVTGKAAPWSKLVQHSDASGIGWDQAAAEGACVSKAIERLQPYALPDDQLVTASYAAWPLAEPAVAPERWVLFHPEQYQQPGFPFLPLTRETTCAWVCCRQALSGDPWWVPAEFVYLYPSVGQEHRIAPGLSTGLACGRTGEPLVLRGLQEVIDRDAVVGAWWNRYPLVEFPINDILEGLRSDARQRLLRPNLTYRCFRITSPYSEHVSLVTLAGEDHEGWCFSVGSACRETAALSWNKALLEAIRARHYVRLLKQQVGDGRLKLGPHPTSFAEHAVWYSVHPRALQGTVLARPQRRGREALPTMDETIASLVERLGPERPVLFRSLTPPTLAAEDVGWHVVRVVVPGLQPLHGNHWLAQLGGSLWAPRGVAEWALMAPHPMP